MDFFAMPTVEEVSAGIIPTLEKVHRQEKVSITEYMQLYTRICNYCQRGRDSLFNNGGAVVYEVLAHYVREFVSLQAAKINSLPTDEMRLAEYTTVWENYKKSVSLVNKGFRFMNLHWVLHYNYSKMIEEKAKGAEQKEKRLDVYTLYMTTWKKEMFEKNESAILDSTRTSMKAEVDQAISEHLNAVQKYCAVEFAQRQQ
ncbi:hypothetical protein QR680_011814 [Steinernema hermaphroditum]|uniref:Cullin N-terminal domain-containing protein n=1 Tax=Steinernema hermaphroditum TaxID=289476 RepID=A0AA39I1M1_9BILA|nr:hypothetical protein QR680_011814 [Steinernema hermaphroditum]